MTKKIILLLCIVFSTLINTVNAQTINLGQDTTLCPGDQLSIAGTGIDSNLIIKFTNPAFVYLTDDLYSAVLDIGFNFTFYGNTFDKFLIGSNGIITFDTTWANSNCSWTKNSNPFPDSSFEKNIIMAPFMDINPDTTFSEGVIKYETIGQAPNRKLVVMYDNPYLYSCGNMCWYSGVILHEVSNEIEIHLKNKPLCTTWQNGYSAEGIQNQDGTIAHMVPGRNYGDLWETTIDGKKWTPVSTDNYNISDIPFKVFVDTLAYLWGSTAGDSITYTDTLNLIGSSSTNIGYFQAVHFDDGCDNFVLALTDTSWINQDSHPYQFTVYNNVCGSSLGVFYSLDSLTTDSSYYWLSSGNYSDSLTGLSSGTYPYLYTGNNGCQLNDSLEIANIPNITFDLTPPLCSYDSSATITILPYNPFLTYDWINPSDSIGNHLENMPTGTFSCYLADLASCPDTVTVAISSISSIATNTVVQTNVSCYGDNDGFYSFDVTGNSGDYQVYWSNQLYPSEVISDLYVGQYILNVTDSLGCSFIDTVIITGPGLPLNVYNINVTPEMYGNDGEVNFMGSGGTPIYTYSIGGTYQNENQFNNLTGGNYTAYIQDANGCIDSMLFTINSFVSLAELSDYKLKVYPNPSNGQFFIESSQQMTSLIIYDVQGTRILDSRDTSSLIVDLGEFMDGIYFMEIQFSDDSLVRIKLVKD